MTMQRESNEWADVDVIFDGALDSHTTVTSDGEIDNIIKELVVGNPDDNWQVFVLWHDHDRHLTSQDGCNCIQYLGDHHPYWSNEMAREDLQNEIDQIDRRIGS
jgi:hypothetical protein